MPSCYFCACHLNNGEGIRRKVLTSESARIYISKRGGGSYGQTYAPRTICQNCAIQLDEKNKTASWQIPISVITGIIGIIFAVRWANSSHSTPSGFESLIYIFFLFGGAGILMHILLKSISQSNTVPNENLIESDNSNTEYQNYSREESNDEVEDELAQHKELIMQLSIELDEIGISIHGCYGFQVTYEDWIAMNEEIIRLIPPKHYPSINAWQRILKKTTYKKFLSNIKNPEQSKTTFPEIEGEDEEGYSLRMKNAIARAEESINQKNSMVI